MEYLLNIELSRQRFSRVSAELRNKPSKPHVTTDPHLPIKILAINMRQLQVTNFILINRYLKHILLMSNMKTSSQPTMKQKRNAYKPKQVPNVEFPGNLRYSEKNEIT